MLFQGLFAIIIFAFVPLAIRFTVATPLTICFFRLGITVLLLSMFWRKKINYLQFHPATKEGKILIGIGIVFFFHWLSYAYAVKIGGASIGVLGMSTYGIQLIVAGFFFLNHKISRKDVICLLLALMGILLIIPSWDFKDEKTFGLVLALFSASMFAILPILHKKLTRINEETRIFSQFFFALIGFGFFISETSWKLAGKDWLALLFLGVGGTFIGHSLWAKISSRSNPTITGLSYYTIAPITILFSHFFMGEVLTATQLTGAVIVIAAALMNVWKTTD